MAGRTDRGTRPGERERAPRGQVSSSYCARPSAAGGNHRRATRHRTRPWSPSVTFVTLLTILLLRRAQTSNGVKQLHNGCSERLLTMVRYAYVTTQPAETWHDPQLIAQANRYSRYTPAQTCTELNFSFALRYNPLNVGPSPDERALTRRYPDHD